METIHFYFPEASITDSTECGIPVNSGITCCTRIESVTCLACKSSRLHTGQQS